MIPHPSLQFTILTEDNWKDHSDFRKAKNHLGFQQTAIALTRDLLPSSKSLIGFIGGPWSVLNYALGTNKVSNDFKTMYLKEVIIPSNG